MTEDKTLARNRFWVLNLVRLLGLAMVLMGIAVEYGKLDMPKPAGYILVVLGLFEFFFMPNIVAKRWRTPNE